VRKGVEEKRREGIQEDGIAQLSGLIKRFNADIKRYYTILSHLFCLNLSSTSSWREYGTSLFPPSSLPILAYSKFLERLPPGILNTEIK
jgi:hypothetical protein